MMVGCLQKYYVLVILSVWLPSSLNGCCIFAARHQWRDTNVVKIGAGSNDIFDRTVTWMT